MNTAAVAAIARKDIVDAIRNRYLLFMLLTPLLVAVLLRLLQPGIDSLATLTIVVHDPGRSRITSAWRASPRIKLVEAGSADGVPAEVEKSKAVGGLVVPANFDAEVAAGKQPELTVYVNQAKGNIRQATFRDLVERQVRSLVEQPVPARAVWIDVGKESDREAVRAPNLNQMMLPLLLLLVFGMAGALVVPLLLVEEKEKHTLDFLVTSPATLSDIVLGKALTGIVYSLLIAGVLLALNRQLVGNWPLTLLVVLVGLLFVVAVGLLMGSLFHNTMQVNTWASLVLMLLMAPSFPTLGLPSVVETVSRVIPTHYFVEALRLASAGTNSLRLWWHVAVVLGCTLLAFFAATWALRRAHN